jgi:hypothetical protein
LRRPGANPGLFCVAARLRAATPDRGYFAEAAAKREAAVEAAKALRARPMSSLREVAAAPGRTGLYDALRQALLGERRAVDAGIVRPLRRSLADALAAGGPLRQQVPHAHLAARDGHEQRPRECLDCARGFGR